MDQPWQRVHPLTPAVKSWQALVGVVVLASQEFGRERINGLFPVGGSGEEVSDGSDFGGIGGVGGFAEQHALLGGLVAALVVAAVLGLMWLSWWMTRYRVTESAVELRRGVISRQHRVASLDRLQAVDVVQPLVGRIVGLSKVTIEIAGSSDSRFELQYLTDRHAQQLRAQLLAASAGLRRVEGEPVREATERFALELPTDRLIWSLLLTVPSVITALVVAGVAVGAVVVNLGVLVFAVPALIGVVGGLWQRFTGSFAFTAAFAEDGLRLRHGLLERRSQTVPLSRVQAVRLSQPMLWRRRGWWRVEANVAGYGGSSDSEVTETMLLPVGTRDEAVSVLAFVLPDLGTGADERPGAVVDAALTGSGAVGRFVTSPRQARWLDWWGWQRCGFRVTGTALIVRRGVFVRRMDVVPHARTQSLAVTQGPLQRALGLVSFALHSTPGPIAPVVPHLNPAVAASLLAEQSARARFARAVER